MCVYIRMHIIYIYTRCQHTPHLLSPEPGAEVGPLDRASQGEAPRLASSGAAGGHVVVAVGRAGGFIPYYTYSIQVIDVIDIHIRYNMV